MHYELPKSLIAQKPASPRNHARLLVYDRRTGKITDDFFYNLGAFLIPGTTLALNNSAVENCRLILGKAEIFVLSRQKGGQFKALVKPGRKFKPGDTYEHEGIMFKTISVEPDGSRVLSCNIRLNSKEMAGYRHTPFPPYIAPDERLAGEYQTIYAGPEGSKAAPTAGLHFTNLQLKQLATSHPIVKLTLHIGLGTFMNPTKHQLRTKKLHAEDVVISKMAAEALNSATHITAVGTTSLRALETVKKPFREYNGRTDIFITTGYRFAAVDSLITNFHLPGSSLLLLVAAFIGSEEITLSLYSHAIKNKYRFYSFGDAMLIL